MKNFVRVLLGPVFLISYNIYAQKVVLPDLKGVVANNTETTLTGNAPITTVLNSSPCEGATSVEVPVYVSSFSNIGALSLTMNYDSSVLSFDSFVNNSGVSGLSVNGSIPGTITAGGFNTIPGGVSLPDNSVLFTLQFNYSGGNSSLNWFDDGSSCEYSDAAPMYNTLNDSPLGLYYVNGLINELLMPSAAGPISGPDGGLVCRGEAGVIFSVPAITNATDYVWALPAGATIVGGNNTNSIVVDFGDNGLSGNVLVYGANTCGSGAVSSPFYVEMLSQPDIITQPVTPDTVSAGAGVADFLIEVSGEELVYQWQEFISSWLDLENGSFYSGVNSANLSITNPLESMDGNRYRCVVTGRCDPSVVSDGNATLHVVVYTGLEQTQILSENYNLGVEISPCPFTTQTTISFCVPEAGMLHADIFNMSGQLVDKVPQLSATIGINYWQYTGSTLKPGAYVVRFVFQSNRIVISQKIKIVRK